MGYGRLTYQGKTWLAHRLALQLAGTEIPEGTFACHHCDNPPCCNPRHLYAGDAASNTADMVARGRAPSLRGSQSPRAKLSELQVLALRVDIRESVAAHRGRLAYSERDRLAEKYGVRPFTIYAVSVGRRYPLVPKAQRRVR